MRTQIPTALIATALLGLASTPARAQNATIDSRWIAYVGCWESVGGPKRSLVCVVPGADTSAIDLVTIENGEVIKAEQILATGARLETIHGECTGWQSAEWSAVSTRLYMRSQERCPDWGTRTGTGMLAMARDGLLLYIQGSTVGMKTGVRVQRYREVKTDLVLPSEVKDALDALHLDLSTTAQAYAAARAPLAVDDLTEASRELDADVVEAWLIERGGSFNIDARRLVALANAGVPSRTTDLLIALAHPGVFTIDATSRGARRVETEESYATSSFSPTPWYGSCAMEYMPFPYASYYCDGFGSYYPYEYSYLRDYPVVIIYNGSGGSGGSDGGSAFTPSHGRVVNGKGYEVGPRTNEGATRWAEPRTGSSGSSSTGAVSPSTTSSSSSGEQRTAKPRP
jgi:hypothetical protein